MNKSKENGRGGLDGPPLLAVRPLILLVGQAPGPNWTPGSEPLAGRCGVKLASLMGLELEEYLRTFQRANLLDFYPGKKGKGDAFPMTKATEAAKAFDPGEARTVILLGRSVARAFGLGRLDFFKHAEVEGRMWFAAPHPSGVSRWWNEPENVVQAEQFFASLAEGKP